MVPQFNLRNSTDGSEASNECRSFSAFSTRQHKKGPGQLVRIAISLQSVRALFLSPPHVLNQEDLTHGPQKPKAIEIKINGPHGVLPMPRRNFSGEGPLHVSVCLAAFVVSADD